jgi:ubiquitin-protein ligase
MDIQRIWGEVRRATASFALVEAHPTSDGGVFVKTGMQTSAGNTYFASIYFPDYPYRMPQVFVTRPALRSDSPHRYRDGNLCYLHPSMWNPGLHDLTFVLAHLAKWLNKYEVWRNSGTWPGAEVRH